MDSSTASDFAQQFAQLTSAQQADVMAFMRQLNARAGVRRTEAEEKARREAILSLAGSISPEDLDLMSRVIEEDCERIDLDGW